MRKAFLLLSVSMLLPAGLLYGCGSGKEAVETGNIEEKEDSALSMEKELERLTRGDVCLDAEKLENYASGFALCYEDVSEQMVYSLEMPQIPQSDDAYLYLFAMECYEDVQTLAGEPAASGLKGTDCEICFPYEEEYLFEQFIPALQIDGKYVSLGEGIYLSNPEALADNKEEYPEPDSKKGLLLDPTMLGTEELTDLGVKHAIYNIPLSIIMGDTTDETFPYRYTQLCIPIRERVIILMGRRLTDMTVCLPI